MKTKTTEAVPAVKASHLLYRGLVSGDIYLKVEGDLNKYVRVACSKDNDNCRQLGAIVDIANANAVPFYGTVELIED